MLLSLTLNSVTVGFGRIHKEGFRFFNMRYESAFSGNYLTPDSLGLGGKVICRQFNRCCSRRGFLHCTASPAEAVSWQRFRRCLPALLCGHARPSALCLPKPAAQLAARQAHLPGIFLTAFQVTFLSVPTPCPSWFL